VTPVAGIGLRAPHLAAVVRDRPETAFLEIHAENYLTPSPAFDTLGRLRADYAFSVHAVGLSLGSADGLDDAHLRRIAALVDRLQPALVSDHLTWSISQGRYLNDLLPLPYTEEAVDVVVRNVDRLQEALGRRIAVENPSCYFSFAHATLSEPEFLSEVVRRSGCGILLDANNLFVTAQNLRLDPRASLDGLPADAVMEYHLAGHAVNDADGEPILIDDHASRVSAPVWSLFGELVECFGAKPTLIEWDADIPSLEILLDEAASADRLVAEREAGGARAA